MPLEALAGASSDGSGEPVEALAYPPNGTCGTVVLRWEGPNGSSSAVECDIDSGAPVALQRLDALVSRGVMLTHSAREELSSVVEVANSTESYFAGGMAGGRGHTHSQDAGRAPGECFLEAVAKFLVAFKGAWDEAQRNEQRWAPYVGGAASRPPVGVRSA